MDGAPVDKAGKCPVLGHAGHHGATGSTANQHWWPNQLNLKVLHQQGKSPSPMGEDFNYAEAFQKLDLEAVRADLRALMTDSQDWWPADYGHYGPFFIRMAWHSAGTYRVGDGRGGAGAGNLRFAPLNSWPDNGNLDKARRLLWPIKQKYGASLSWADLMILTGNVALESMGFETFGFAGGRADIWEPEEDIYWGPETEWLSDDAERYNDPRELVGALGAVQMGLIYVNPEGPMGNPDPLASAHDVRETFMKMAMNDEETVALVAGGHTFGKAHGAADPGKYVGAEPEGAPLEAMATGWANSFESGRGVHTITSGIEGAWTRNPIAWDHDYFDILLGYDWQLSSSPAGAHQWVPTDATAAEIVPDAHDPARRHAPIMTTADLALREDPAYRKISENFRKDPAAFADAFARAWYKLTHRDMGPYENGLGPLVPAEPQLWQDPVPKVSHPLVSDADITALKAAVLDTGLSVSELTRTAWASAATYRGSDKRGGANGARIRLSPAKDWEVNNPSELARVLDALDGVKATFDAKGATKISMADLIVLAGVAAVEKAARDAGHDVSVPFTPGRADATQEMTDEHSYGWLEPRSDAMRNYVQAGQQRAPAELMIDRAQLLTLNAPEMTVLVGGMRALGANWDGSSHGIFTSRVGQLTNDYFVNVLDMGTEWRKQDDGSYAGHDRATGAAKWTGTAVDLVFGSNSQLRAISEVYGARDGETKLVSDFIAAWTKVMNADRTDLK